MKEDNCEESIKKMMRGLVDLSRRSYRQMAGSCPCYGSGATKATPTVARKSRGVATKIWTAEEIERDKLFRDELYKYWEISML